MTHPRTITFHGGIRYAIPPYYKIQVKQDVKDKHLHLWLFLADLGAVKKTCSILKTQQVFCCLKWLAKLGLKTAHHSNSIFMPTILLLSH
ncbi:MAG: hypothetical protein RIS84_412 [Pseudomonadota bacterium]|jgi:hypothetical protein